jgi:transcriptional regulator with XRE-family HTH domain
MVGMEQPPHLESVIASNVARLREARSLTQDQLAQGLLLHGLRWDRATVAMVETDRRKVRLTEAVVLCAALDVSMADLVTPPGDAVTVDTGTWSASYLRAVVERDEDYSGAEYTSPAQKAVNRLALAALETHSQWRTRAVKNLEARWDLDPNIRRGEMKRILGHDDPMDTAVAARIENRTLLGVAPGDVKLAALRIWGRSFHDERERRAAERPGNRQAVRGRITRKLEVELEQAIEEAADRAAERLGQ